MWGGTTGNLLESVLSFGLVALQLPVTGKLLVEAYVGLIREVLLFMLAAI